MRILIFVLLIFFTAYPSQIKWHSFEEGLNLAKKEKKLILLDIYAQWCHWCNVMENTTYRDKRVINLIHKHFIPVRVDAEERPEINKRYNQGGLPSTVILTEKGDVLWGGIYVPPDEMERLLEYFSKLDRESIKKLVLKNKKREELFKKQFLKKLGEKEPSWKYIKKVFRSVKLRFDYENGGFYGSPKFPQEELPHFLMIYYLVTGSREAYGMLEKTLQGYSKLIDRVEGGIFRYSVNEYWNQPHYEKLLKDQADLSVMFFDAYSLTGKREYLLNGLSLVNFSLSRLYSKQEDLFFNSQGADIVDEEGSILLTGEEFFPLSKKEREKTVKNLGYRPKIEKRFYSSTNALIVKALLYSYAYTKDKRYLDTGLKTLNKLLKEFYTDKGVIYYKNSRKLLLSPNVYTLEAVLTAYQITGKKEYLKKALNLFEILIANFYSKEIGLLVEQDSVFSKRISFVDDITKLNLRAVKMFYLLNLITHREKYLQHAYSIIKHLPGRVNLSTAIAFLIKLSPPVIIHTSHKGAVSQIFTLFPYWVFVQPDSSYKENGFFVCNHEICFFREKSAKRLKKQVFSILKNYSLF